MTILGAVLAGGQSRRFGSDKAIANWRSRPLIEHVLATLHPFANELVICGREFAGIPSIPDRPAPDFGPLGGLCAALAYANEHGFARAILAPCDTPALPPSMLARLVGSDGAACYHDLPVLGIWPTSLAPVLDRFLADGANGRSMRAFARSVGAETLLMPLGETVDNINYPDDLARLNGRIITRPQQHSGVHGVDR